MLATRRADDEHKEEQEPTSRGLFSDLRKHPLVAYALVSAACVIMTFAGVLVKVMTAVDPFLLAAVRNCVIFLCSMPRLIRRNIDVAPRGGGKLKFLFARAFFTALYTMSLFYSFRYMPLGDARTITSTNPVFTSIFAWFVLGEPFGLFEVLVLISTVTGMVIVLHPPSLFEDAALSAAATATAYDSTYTYAAIFASVGTVFQALGVVATGAVRDVDVAVVTAWNGFLGMFPPLVATLAMGAFALPSAADALLALLIGILGFFGHSLMVLALQVQCMYGPTLLSFFYSYPRTNTAGGGRGHRPARQEGRRHPARLPHPDPLLPAVPRFGRGHGRRHHRRVGGRLGGEKTDRQELGQRVCPPNVLPQEEEWVRSVRPRATVRNLPVAGEAGKGQWLKRLLIGFTLKGTRGEKGHPSHTARSTLHS